jgi:hypothetical protein
VTSKSRVDDNGGIGEVEPMTIRAECDAQSCRDNSSEEEVCLHAKVTHDLMSARKLPRQADDPVCYTTAIADALRQRRIDNEIADRMNIVVAEPGAMVLTHENTEHSKIWLSVKVSQHVQSSYTHRMGRITLIAEPGKVVFCPCGVGACIHRRFALMHLEAHFPLFAMRVGKKDDGGTLAFEGEGTHTLHALNNDARLFRPLQPDLIL